MRTMGYDPSSQCAGLAIAVDGGLREIAVWKPDSKGDKPLSRLCQWGSWFEFYLAAHAPDMLAVEVIRVSTSHDTTRSLSRHEALALYIARSSGVICLEHGVSEARKIVFGRGNIPKEEAFERIKSDWPGLPWLKKGSGGMDQSDAAVMALAANQLAERH